MKTIKLLLILIIATSCSKEETTPINNGSSTLSNNNLDTIPKGQVNIYVDQRINSTLTVGIACPNATVQVYEMYNDCRDQKTPKWSFPVNSGGKVTLILDRKLKDQGNYYCSAKGLVTIAQPNGMRTSNPYAISPTDHEVRSYTISIIH